MIEIGKGAKRKIEDYALSRFACYLIAMNGDTRKETIALAQTYFAIKTRQQELIDEYEKLSDDQKRYAIRQEMKKHNKSLADAAHIAGVIQPVDFAIFQNSGYKGLYGGLSRKDIHTQKELKNSQDILDHMGHEELAANLFRATQTEAKLRRDNIKGKMQANQTHYSDRVHCGARGLKYGHLRSLRMMRSRCSFSSFFLNRLSCSLSSHPNTHSKIGIVFANTNTVTTAQNTIVPGKPKMIAGIFKIGEKFNKSPIAMYSIILLIRP